MAILWNIGKERRLPLVGRRRNEMDVKEAVRKAKDHVEVMFEGENLQNVGLEEVTFNESNKRWLVTVGFSRV